MHRLTLSIVALLSVPTLSASGPYATAADDPSPAGSAPLRNWTVLREAIGDNATDISRIRQLIRKVDKIDRRDENGLTLLHHAIRNQRQEAVDALISSGLGPDAHAAAAMGRNQRLKQLIEDRPGVLSAPLRRMSPLDWAVEYGPTNTVKLLLEKGANPNQAEGFSPLHRAISNQNPEMVELLLQYGAAPNQVAEIVGSPLWWACVHDSGEIVARLVEYGADLREYRGRSTPLSVAAKNGSVAVLGRLAALRPWKAGEMGYALVGAARAVPEPQIDAVVFLLERGANPNAAGWKGASALEFAVYRNHTKLTGILIQHGANVNETDIHGNTPLHLAVSSESYGSAEVLIEHGARQMRNGMGERPADQARRRGDQRMLTIIGNIEDKPPAESKIIE